MSGSALVRAAGRLALVRAAGRLHGGASSSCSWLLLDTLKLALARILVFKLYKHTYVFGCLHDKIIFFLLAKYLSELKLTEPEGPLTFALPHPFHEPAQPLK